MSASWLRQVILPVTWPASWLFGSMVGLRNHLYERGHLRVNQLPRPVISVGNLTVGGSGKTPLVATIARYFISKERTVAVLSRGYLRRDNRAFFVVSDGRQILADVTEAGDEPMELARSVEGLAVAVGADRYQVGLEVIRTLAPEIFVLDDGFQHRRLYRNLDILCLDATEPLSGLKLLPAGRLRERLNNMNRASALVWTGWTKQNPSEPLVSRVLGALESEIPVFRAVHKIIGFSSVTGQEKTLSPSAFEGQPVAVLAAVAKPYRFVEALEDIGVKVVWSYTKRDHHAWRPDEVKHSAEKAKQRGAEAVLTTGKDGVKLTELDGLALPLYQVDMRPEILEKEAFETLLDSVLPSANP